MHVTKLKEKNRQFEKAVYILGKTKPCACACLVAQACPTLFSTPWISPPGSSVHGISQARILEWVAISFSRGSSWPRDQIQVSWLTGRFFTTEPPGKPQGTLASSDLNRTGIEDRKMASHPQGLWGTPAFIRMTPGGKGLRWAGYVCVGGAVTGIPEATKGLRRKNQGEAGLKHVAHAPYDRCQTLTETTGWQQPR